MWFGIVLANCGYCLTSNIFTAERLSHIRIGTTDVSPLSATPALTNYELCASYDGPVGAGATQTFYCGSSGRYLIIQLQKTDILTLCEVQVQEGVYRYRLLQCLCLKTEY